MTTTLKTALQTIAAERTCILSNGAEDFSPEGAIDTLQDNEAHDELEREVELGRMSDGRFAIRAIDDNGYIDNGEPLFVERHAA